MMSMIRVVMLAYVGYASRLIASVVHGGFEAQTLCLRHGIHRGA
jgi:hypothetical protein